MDSAENIHNNNNNNNNNNDSTVISVIAHHAVASALQCDARSADETDVADGQGEERVWAACLGVLGLGG